MAAPQTYTESQLAVYCLDTLGPVAAQLGWTAFSPAVDEIVNETLFRCGVSDIADVTDINRLRVTARWQAWRVAVDYLANQYTIGMPGGGGQLTRSQLYDHAKERLDAAYLEMRRLLSRASGTVQVVSQVAVAAAERDAAGNG